jgi:hypothetical protein
VLNALTEDLLNWTVARNIFSIRIWLWALFISAVIGGIPGALIGETVGWIVFWIAFVPIFLLLITSSTARCPHCGKAVKIGASVCHHCGRDAA